MKKDRVLIFYLWSHFEPLRLLRLVLILWSSSCFKINRSFCNFPKSVTTLLRFNKSDKLTLMSFFFFLSEIYFVDIHELQDCRGKGRAIPHYHFHPLHRHLYISWVITGESSPLHIANSRTRTGNLWFRSASCWAMYVYLYWG